MARFKGELRDGEKVMRGLKRTDTPIHRGYQLCIGCSTNYIRGHKGLNGDTPAERVGIKVEGEERRRALIQNASKRKLRANA